MKWREAGGAPAIGIEARKGRAPAPPGLGAKHESPAPKGHRTPERKRSQGIARDVAVVLNTAEPSGRVEPEGVRGSKRSIHRQDVVRDLPPLLRISAGEALNMPSRVAAGRRCYERR